MIVQPDQIELGEVAIRSTADPASSSARPVLSAQIRSPVVAGRLGSAAVHWSSPAG